MGWIIQSDHAYVPALQRHHQYHQEPGANLPGSSTRQELAHRCRARRAANHGDSQLTELFPADHRSQVRRVAVFIRDNSTDQGRIPGEPANLSAIGRPVRGEIPLAARGSEWQSDSREWSARQRQHPERILDGLAFQLSPGAGHSGLSGLRLDARGAARVQVSGSTAHTRRLLRKDQLSIPPVKRPA